MSIKFAPNTQEKSTLLPYTKRKNSRKKPQKETIKPLKKKI